MSLVAIARLFLFVREAQHLGQNKGARVEAIQRWSLGQSGDSYCCEFATMVLDIACQGEAPIPRLQACQDVYEMAIQQGWLVDDPQAGDLFLYVNDADHAHHIGICCGEGRGIAGNTSPDGRSSNGDGVYEHPILPPSEGKIVYVRVPGVEP